MNIPVFAQVDVNPELWTDFVQTAAVPANPNLESETEPQIPYILVSSKSPSSPTTPTKEISTTEKSDLKSSSDGAIQTLFTNIIDNHNDGHLSTQFFLVLDDKSAKERTVMLMQKASKWVDQNGDVDEGGPAGRDDLTEKVTWKKYCIPFDRVYKEWSVLETRGYVSEQWFVGEDMEDA
ncbi:hypothetical protein EJ05DRAFT_472112 [Pseudovirgaria hyperparasitica]|uniref:Uncharacterized protein n=1 Tax=Pseudovirgaria hyperparasitica TaxID=470096 RepID=A0A6A6WM19_9PEZI|nr:uncharacterized protein EJ05DRAFT_472112 [Pseudovirgaria hyperparasitica]KAF2763198.1 hypothetical protein EJ05DRAFT_472112 [Pseudovirgaria hyperparasitica]